MKCPYCHSEKSKVLETRECRRWDRRRRKCLDCGQLYTTKERVREEKPVSDMRLINATELEDLFEYGIDDMAVLGNWELDQKVQDLIKMQQTINAVPYYKIARTIIRIRQMGGELDYVSKKEVIDMLWRLIDKRPDVEKMAKEIV